MSLGDKISTNQFFASRLHLNACNRNDVQFAILNGNSHKGMKHVTSCLEA